MKFQDIYSITITTVLITVIFILHLMVFKMLKKIRSMRIFSISKNGRTKEKTPKGHGTSKTFLPANTSSSRNVLEEFHIVSAKSNIRFYAVRCIELIKEYPAFLNIRDPYDLSPFQKMCLNGRTCLVEFALAKGANPLLKTNDGLPTIYLSVYYYIGITKNQGFPCLEALLKAGCTLEADDHFRKVINLSIQSGKLELTKWLLQHLTTDRHLGYLERTISAP